MVKFCSINRLFTYLGCTHTAVSFRPRECTSSSLEDGESTTSIAYEKNIESIQIVQENGLKDDAFEVQETSTVEEAPSSQFIINKNDVSKVDNYQLVQATSNDTAPKM